MSIEYIQKYYGVPAKIGGSVEYTNSKGEVRKGKITGFSGPHLKIKLEGDKNSMPYHPMYNIKYLDAVESSD